MHVLVDKVEDAEPQKREIVADTELLERLQEELAQQRGRTQPSLLGAHGVAQEGIGREQVLEQWEENLVKALPQLLILEQVELWDHEHLVQNGQCTYPDLSLRMRANRKNQV